MKRHHRPQNGLIHLPDNLPISLMQHQMQNSDLWTVRDSDQNVNYTSTEQKSSFKTLDLLNEDTCMKKNIPEVSGTEVTDRKYSIHFVSRIYLLLGQCFGLIPVCGIFSDDPRDLKLKWQAKRMLYTLLTIVVVLILSVLQIVKAIRTHGLSQSTADDIVGYVVYFFTIIIFVCQARSWRKLIIKWSKVEYQMRHIHPVLDLEEKTRLFVLGFIFATLFLIFARVVSGMAALSPCSGDWTLLLQLTLVQKYLSLFSLVEFSIFKAGITFVLLLHENMVAVYDELTIIVLAYCLRERFKQLRFHLLSIKNEKLPSSYWARMRVTYNNLSSLGKLLDGHLSCMTLVCFGGNLYHICSLLLLSLKSEDSKLVNWCMFYTLMFLIGRTYMAALTAASVYEESKKPLALLFSVPSDSYNAEVCRFQMQVTHDEITITGCHFFSVTRSFMLTVAGTIMTYEIVLLQFGSLGENIEIAFNKSTCTSLLSTLNNHNM